LTGRDETRVKEIETYLRDQGLFVKHDGSQPDAHYSGDILELDMGNVVPSLSGPKRPHDRVNMTDMKTDFTTALTNKLGFKGY